MLLSYSDFLKSERTSLYQEHATRLLESGHAYRCFCSAERLNELAQERAKLGLPSDYDRACASRSKEESDGRAFGGETHVVRLKMPDQEPQFTDLVYGVIGNPRRLGRKSQKQGVMMNYEDPILIKSDGRPTYHLANVVDDHHMRITHVIRATVRNPIVCLRVMSPIDSSRNGCHRPQNTLSCIMPLAGNRLYLPMWVY